MDCLDGHGAMLQRRVAGKVVDHCSSCQGTWLDPGELWRELERPVSDEELLRRHLVFEGLNMARDCPRCSTPLSNATVGAVVVSACLDCMGLWLDQKAHAGLKDYRPPVPVAPPPAVPQKGIDPYDEGPNAPAMPVHGTGVGQTEAHIQGVGNVMKGLTDVLWSVVYGLQP